MLVLWDHSYISDWSSRGGQMLDTIEVPLFFVLCGMTWRTPQRVWEWLRGKYHRLIVPYLFFVAVAVVVNWLTRDVNPVDLHHLGGNLVSVDGNPNLWFLRALFWCLGIYCGLQLVWHKNGWGVAGSVLVIAVIGWWLADYGLTQQGDLRQDSRLVFWMNALGLSQALVCLPLVWVGNVITLYCPLKQRVEWNRWIIGIVIICAVIWVTFARPSNALVIGRVYDYRLFYFCAVAGTIVLLGVCAFLHYVPVINFMGRYSLVFLGLNLPIMYVLERMGNGHGWWRLILTTTIALALTWLLNRYAPRLIGEKSARGSRK